MDNWIRFARLIPMQMRSVDYLALRCENSCFVNFSTSKICLIIKNATKRTQEYYVEIQELEITKKSVQLWITQSKCVL